MMIWKHCNFREEKKDVALRAPIGTWLATYGESGLYRLAVLEKTHDPTNGNRCPKWLETAWDTFWDGRTFGVTLCTEKKPSPSTEAVWKVVLEIPFGTTRTYGEVAIAAGISHGARAVGSIMRSNPWALFIPCHRVLGKNGQLCGYGGKAGIGLKARLIEYERGKKGKAG